MATPCHTPNCYKFIICLILNSTFVSDELCHFKYVIATEIALLLKLSQVSMSENRLLDIFLMT
jgi:hypothetical protein